MDYTYDFGANIKEARKSKKYTQTRLANAIGVTYGAISKYENGAIIPSLEVMCNIAVSYTHLTLPTILRV